MKDYWQTVHKLPPRAIADLLSRGVTLDPLERGVSVVRDRYGDVLKLLMVSVSLLILIVCANVGGLLLARAAAREQEVAVRLAVGATRVRLVRQVLAESLLLAVPGAVGGFAIALAAMPVVARVLPPIRDVSTSIVALSLDVNINWRVFLFLLAVSMLTMLLFSLGPAIAVSRKNLESLLRAAPVKWWLARAADLNYISDCPVHLPARYCKPLCPDLPTVAANKSGVRP